MSSTRAKVHISLRTRAPIRLQPVAAIASQVVAPVLTTHETFNNPPEPYQTLGSPGLGVEGLGFRV